MKKWQKRILKYMGASLYEINEKYDEYSNNDITGVIIFGLVLLILVVSMFYIVVLKNII